MNARSWTLLGLLAAVWGGSYLLIAVGLTDLSPAALVLLRLGLGALVLTPFALRHVRTLRGHLRVLPVVALFQAALPFLLIAFAEQRIASGLAGVLVSSQPMWLVLFSPALLGTGRPRLPAVGGVLAGFAGVALVAGYDGSGAADPLGVALVLAAAASYAVGGALARRAMTGVHALTQSWATLAVSAVLVAPFAVLDPPAHVGLPAAAAVAVLAVAGTGLAFVVYNKLIKDAGPVAAAVVSYLAPGFALGYGAVLRHEPVTWAALAGVALILGGSYLATRATRRPAAAPAAEPVATPAACAPARR